MAFLAHLLSSLGGWRALALVFGLPMLEASAFVGFVFPGETAVVLGGVLASQHRVSLWQVLVAAVAGAIIGDSVGYAVGHRWGEAILRRTAGRLVKQDHIDRARGYVARRGGWAVFLGRFATVLRVLVPGTAGMAGMHYPRFLVFNAAGGTVWAVSFVVAGYLAGASWRVVVHDAGTAGAVVVGVVVVAGLTVMLARRRRRRRRRGC
ncbi:MAG TPA: DedA family protein [Acidimicrobiales bacterium]|nr:DedA family protein [Acidimicrobiales bacterium]